ncbi:MAG TPA: AsmA-like C-terminal region-containing protein, partial [Xanthomonadales bacterium]|nr:AsmA-like C-terminal region-containing protein [Xanthomonadales bacterium]
ELSGNRVVRGSGGIASLKDPVLALRLAGEGDAANWLQFLKDSPLRRSYADVLFGMSMRGPAKVAADLSIPLRKNLGKASVEGQALLEGIAFRDTKWNLAFDEVRGRADFSDAGFAADRLNLSTDGHAGELGIAVGRFSSDPALQVEASLSGSLSAQTLFGQYDALKTILDQVQGKADWTVDLKVHRPVETGDRGRTELHYRSSLQGIAVGFPAPLGKLAGLSLPLHLQVQLPASETEAPVLRLDLGPQARLFAVVGTTDSDFRGQLQLGVEQAQDLPARGLRVSGIAADVDLPGWAGWVVATTTASKEESVLTDVDLQMAGQQRLMLDRSDGPWVLKLEGPTAQGFVRFEESGDRPAAVVAQFERLHLPEPGDGAVDLTLTPSMVPTLHLWVKELRIGEAQLGEARLEAFASDTGLRVDLLEARSADLEIHATGDWMVSVSGSESRFKIRMLSEDLGRMLKGLGFAGVIAGGQTLAEIDAHWRGAPYAFALERLTGSIDVSVGQGRFLDVNPGAGRIFGLLSLRELPRRLTLDFRDLFQAGMSFDRIEGRFELADGNAWTENLTVRGPAADLLIIGRTGLSSRDYDQQVMVAPHVSGVLPVLGVLAAGPVGAAAGFLAQGMVGQGNDIEKSSRVHYSIAGSWEKPVVARLTPVRPDAPPPRRRSDPAPRGAG